jgi:hypothetical protein
MCDKTKQLTTFYPGMFMRGNDLNAITSALGNRQNDANRAVTEKSGRIVIIAMRIFNKSGNVHENTGTK